MHWRCKLSLITVCSLLVSLISPALPPPSAHAVAVDPLARLTLTNGLTLETATTFRTTVRLSHPQQLKRVIETGATMLIVEGLRLGHVDLTNPTSPLAPLLGGEGNGTPPSLQGKGVGG